MLPGGVANPDFLRTDEDAVELRARRSSSRPSRSASICHGPWTLVEAGVVRGPHDHLVAVAADRHRATRARTWVDEEVHVDKGLVSSRNPDDLPAFCAKIVEEFVEGKERAATLRRSASARGTRGRYCPGMDVRDLLDPEIVPSLAGFPFEHIDADVLAKVRLPGPAVS